MALLRCARVGVIASTLLVILLTTGAAIGQQNMPERIQIYRFIRSTSHERAGDIRWVEIWESIDDTRNAHEVVMVDGRGGQQGTEVSCYYALAIGSGMPIYMVNGERVPVDTADRLWDIFENKRLIAQSALFATGADCDAERTGTVNGVDAQQCVFEDVDASTLFLIRPPATSHGELWTATSGSYPVRYEFEALGTDTDIYHRFEALIPPDDFAVEPPHDVSLACFESGFPIPESTQPLTTGSMIYAAFESDLDRDELERFYDRILLPTWSSEGSDEQGARIYKRVLASGNECQLHVSFTRNMAEGKTVLAASVYPSYVNVANLPVPEGYASPVVVQSFTDATVTIDGDIATILEHYTADLEAEGWVQHLALTNIREDSAFVTFDRGDYALHIMIDHSNGKATLRIQTQTAVCGPIFSLPS